VVAVLPAANQDPAPRHGYFVAPRALLRGHRLGRDRGLRVIGYYHSHPDSPALPSRRDDAEALPGDAYLIVALQSGAVSEVRCFRAAGGGGGRGMDELPVVVAGAPPPRRVSGRIAGRVAGGGGGKE
jgi:proteasome lid subunit RPN8/RPN11